MTNEMTSEAIGRTVLSTWHDYTKTHDAEILRTLLHEDCVFVSPVVFTPQKGREIAMVYLRAAFGTFEDSGFHYTHELVGAERMVLEFECEIDGIHVNGIDIIDFDTDGRITQFKVLIRPLQAVNKVWESMGKMLEARKSA